MKLRKQDVYIDVDTARFRNHKKKKKWDADNVACTLNVTIGKELSVVKT
jgi:hypothetical protein